MASYLVTGTSKGFGLALVRQLVALPSSTVSHVFATVRSDAPHALQDIVKSSGGRVSVLNCQVTDSASCNKAASQVESALAGKGLDVLINNVGICQASPDGIHSMDVLQESFTTNVMSVHEVTRAFLPLLKKGSLKKVVNISTTLGSITLAKRATFLPAPAYKITKAAMNALTVQYALEYEKQGFSFIALSPGWMKTELGGGDFADLTTDEGAKASLEIILKPGQEYNGKFPKVLVKGWENNPGNNQYDGTIPPW